ncbi:TetR/AcrR family transcriptional regulator [Alicyclobacillus sp. ALC3]|uniref:TetR/AcrR family transcriptional regulator n=1 Tax=Alicyclobacillus sp. ALC3 TaxID=2796143 RepID=UPI002379EF2D|nr:TetR/AcrR family transcriptional regulator [Alicyclobacillus sp. ALC3]WDL98455.1 WHG domain-containing protein [Alicyclobacillus sp. ALC3]
MPQRTKIDLPTILKAATEIVDSKGLESLGLATLAQKLGIRSPSLYNHVDGLPGLRVELAIHGCCLLNSVLMRAAIGKSGDNAVYALAEEYLVFARSHPGLYEAVQRVSDPQEERWQQAAQRLVETVVQVFQYYGWDDYTSIHAVRSFRSMVHGFISLEQNEGFKMPIDVDDSYRFLIDTFLLGLHSKMHAAQCAVQPE